MAIRFRDLPAYLLLRFYALAVLDGGEGIARDDNLGLLRVGGASNFLLKKAIDSLAKKSLVSVQTFQDEAGVDFSEYAITEAGFHEVEQALSLDAVEIEDIIRDDEVVLSAAQIDFYRDYFVGEKLVGSPKRGIPAADRVVQIGDNSAQFLDAVEKFDSAIEKISKANDIGDLTAEERTIVLSELSNSRRLLSAETLRLSAVRALIEPKLRWIADKAAGTAVGEVALTALKALLNLFGISI